MGCKGAGGVLEDPEEQGHPMANGHCRDDIPGADNGQIEHALHVGNVLGMLTCTRLFRRHSTSSLLFHGNHGANVHALALLKML